MLDPLERRLILGIAVVCIGALSYGALSYGARLGHKERVADAALAAANVAHGAVEVHQTEAVTHDQEAEAQKPQANSNAAEVARLRGELAVLRNAPKPDPGHVGLDAPVPDLQPIVDKQCELISAYKVQVEGLEGNVATLTLARDSWRSMAQASQQESAQLRVVIASRPSYSWAAGGSYGTDKQVGAWIEKDSGRLRYGLDVVRHQLAGGNSTLEAVARLGWRFK
jgi:hypothetical protein